MEIVKSGSIYDNGIAQSPGFACNETANLFLGDTVSGKELQWVKLKNGLLVADRCVCTEISWEQLHNAGFVFGTPVTMDGETYLCRCLKVGVQDHEPNEWDVALDETGEDNGLWHWDEALFWGQETFEYSSSFRTVRGWAHARLWDIDDVANRSPYTGFRPALEYLGSKSCPPDTLLGKEVKIYGPDGITAEGRLVDFSDYDIVLNANFVVPPDCSWVRVDKNNIIISRNKVVWLKEA